MLTCHVEPFSAVIEEARPLLAKHWDEIALDKDKAPLDPQYPVYFEREKRGELLIVTVRSAGALVGYFAGFVAPGLHYASTLTCIMDIFFIEPGSRGRRAGLKLFKFTRAELKRRGVKRWFVGSKEHKDASRLFEALGMKKIETTYGEWLGD